MPFQIHLTPSGPAQHSADLLAIAVHDGAVTIDKEGKAEPAVAEALAEHDRALGGLIARVAAAEEFTGKEGTQLSLHTHGKLPAARLVLLGVGKKRDADRDRDQLRVAAAKAVRAARQAGARSLAIGWAWPAHEADLAADARALAEGAVLGGYRFDKYFKEKKLLKLERLDLLVPKASPKAQAALREAIALGEQVGHAVCLARSLVNEPAGEMTPAALAAAAAAVAARHSLKLESVGKAAIEQLEMRLFLAVARGSAHEPRLVRMSYEPAGYKAPKRGKDGRSEALAIVGKALTFDSGGLSLKTAAGMEEMKVDMAGAAAAIAAMDVIAGALKPPFPVHVYFGACENMPSGEAVRPGDVVIGKSGTSVEILNTDAEGRLVLADVLTWACEEKPAAIIDLATLTGACVVALGPLLTGLFSNDDALAGEVLAAARAAGEEFWRLPLPPQNEEFIKSPIADLKNTGGRFGGAIHAALFLQHFVGKTPWVHLDIAGPATVDRERGVHPRGATGVGARTLIEFVRRRMSK